MGLSVCIITWNEEDNLPRCLASVAGLADQVVVVDSLSTDGTRRIAREAGAVVVEQAWLGHVRQKQVALDRATEDWVLCLDADEWLDETLAAAVADVVAGREPPTAGALPAASGGPAGIAGWEVDRRSLYLGDWIEHGGWAPEWRLRLVRRGRARSTGVDPHDRLEADGPVGRLAGLLRHRPYRGLADHIERINRYTDTQSLRKFEAGERADAMKLLLRPPARFLRMYLLRAGFLDGWRGLVLSSVAAFYVFLKYAKLRERWAEAEAAAREGDGR